MIKKLILGLAIMASITVPSVVLAADKWQGTDDMVDSKMEEIIGVSAKEPLIDISQGNLGLFLFTAGGFAAGAVVGYQWRRLLHEKAGNMDD